MFGEIQESTNQVGILCSIAGNLSSSSITLMAMNLGVPGVRPSLVSCFLTKFLLQTPYYGWLC